MRIYNLDGNYYIIIPEVLNIYIQSYYSYLLYVEANDFDRTKLSND